MRNLCEVSEKDIASKTQLLMNTLGRNIKRKRIEIKLKRVELAFYANITESMICNIENGKKPGISIYTLVKISSALEITMDDLFCE
jgi:transcriptional regulator with XRE-family HTH domain